MELAGSWMGLKIEQKSVPIRSQLLLIFGLRLSEVYENAMLNAPMETQLPPSGMSQ